MLVVLAASLHVLYIIRVGGDFMHGRMLLLPLFALLLPLYFGLDGVLYSMPVSDALTFALSLIVICRTYSTLSRA